MDHESEVIKQQMEETRASLAEKLEALEEHVASTVQSTTEAVASTVQSTTEAVTGTVEAVKDVVHDTVESVSESVENVKEAFDIRRHVREHPWAMLGGAVVAGYLGSVLLERGFARVSNEVSKATSSAPPAPAPERVASTGNGWDRPAAPEPSEPSMIDRLTETLKPTIDQLKGLALGATSGVIGRMVLDAVPETLRGEVEQVIDQFTRSVGGKPMPSVLHPKQNQGQNPAEARASAPPARS